MALKYPAYGAHRDPDDQFQVKPSDESPMANLMRSVLGAVGQFEGDLIRERQREGIALAKHEAHTPGVKRL